jgi:hypothetical protein
MVLKLPKKGTRVRAFFDKLYETTELKTCSRAELRKAYVDGGNGNGGKLNERYLNMTLSPLLKKYADRPERNQYVLKAEWRLAAKAEGLGAKVKIEKVEKNEDAPVTEVIWERLLDIVAHEDRLAAGTQVRTVEDRPTKGWTKGTIYTVVVDDGRFITVQPRLEDFFREGEVFYRDRFERQITPPAVVPAQPAEPVTPAALVPVMNPEVDDGIFHPGDKVMVERSFRNGYHEIKKDVLYTVDEPAYNEIGNLILVEFKPKLAAGVRYHLSGFGWSTEWFKKVKAAEKGKDVTLPVAPVPVKCDKKGCACETTEYAGHLPAPNRPKNPDEFPEVVPKIGDLCGTCGRKWDVHFGQNCPVVADLGGRKIPTYWQPAAPIVKREVEAQNEPVKVAVPPPPPIPVKEELLVIPDYQEVPENQRRLIYPDPTKLKFKAGDKVVMRWNNEFLAPGIKPGTVVTFLGYNVYGNPYINAETMNGMWEDQFELYDPAAKRIEATLPKKAVPDEIIAKLNQLSDELKKVMVGGPFMGIDAVRVELLATVYKLEKL